MNIYLLQYNAYINRRVIGYDTIASYRKYIIASTTTRNFSPKDGLSTTITFTDNEGVLTPTNYPNYLIACDDTDNTIISRWFILSCNHKGADNYNLELLRDDKYDFKDELKKSLIYCKYGYKDITSPLFLNSDNSFNMNKIKYKEVELKEDDNMYIYFYMPKNETYVSTESDAKMAIGCMDISPYNAINTSSGSLFVNTNTTTVKMTVDGTEYTLNDDDIDAVYTEFNASHTNTVCRTGFINSGNITRNGKRLTFSNPSSNSPVIQVLVSHIISFITDETLKEALTSTSSTYVNVSITDMLEYQKTVETVEGIAFGLKDSDYNTVGTINNVFNIFCVKYTKGNLAYVSLLAETGAVYDIQLLPYKPCEGPFNIFNPYLERFYLASNVVISGTENKANQLEVYCLKQPTRSFYLSLPDSYNEDEDGNEEPYNYGLNNYEKNKVGQQCYEVRLVSPDGQAIEVVQSSSNYDGTEHLLDEITVNLKFQPYSPYIQLLPKYKGYQKSFKDFRGLICGCGFSCAMATDQWASYQLNNKNYKEQFNRDVDTMKLNSAVDLAQGMADTAASTLNGATYGGAIGSAGGILSGIINLPSQQLTNAYNLETYYKEFQWNCENIQARPQTLNKIDAMVPNFKHPYLEVYKATDEEITRYSSYLKKHGSPIMAEGKLSDFIGGNGYYFIKGHIDEFNSDNVPMNIIEHLNQELELGFYYEVN